MSPWKRQELLRKAYLQAVPFSSAANQKWKKRGDPDEGRVQQGGRGGPSDLPNPTEFKKFLLYARQMEIRGVDLDAPYYNYIISFTVPDIDNVTVLDYDAREQRVYWSDVRTQAIKRAFINGTGVETVVSAGTRLTHAAPLPVPSMLHKPATLSPDVPPDLPNAHGLAVDWVSRNLFWTSYDTNKKQINVARLDGSFKNAVVQGLEQPHGLVVHPLRG